MFKRFNKLTESEFTALAGTDKFANMISNKFVTDDFDICEWLYDNALGQYCVIKDMGNQWIIYFESQEDIARIHAHLDTPLTEAPPVNTINIQEEFK